MKIGFDISQIAYRGTGVEVYTANLVKELIKCDKINEYLLFGSSLRQKHILNKFISSLLKQKNYQTKIFPIPQSILVWLWNRRHILSIEKFIGKLDIFHTSDWTEPPGKCKKVTTIHDLLIYKYPQYLDKRIVENQKNKLHWVVKDQDAVIADSNSTKLDIISYLRIPEEKIRVIYLGVDDHFQPQDNQKIDFVKNKYQISGKYFLCVGTNNPRKNLSRIIQAFNMLQNTGYKLVIAGNYGWGEKINPPAGGQRSIIQLNYINNNDLPVLYSGSEAFIYPSLYEGFGLPVLEAMACGVPVVTSDRGSLEEISRDYVIKVDPDSEDSIKEGMEYIINLPSPKRLSLIETGISHTKKFTWKKCAQETMSLYKSL